MVWEVGQPRQVAGLQVEAVVVARLHFFLVRLGRATQSTRATQVAPEQAASQGTTSGQHFIFSTFLASNGVSDKCFFLSDFVVVHIKETALQDRHGLSFD